MLCFNHTKWRSQRAPQFYQSLHIPTHVCFHVVLFNRMALCVLWCSVLTLPDSRISCPSVCTSSQCKFTLSLWFNVMILRVRAWLGELTLVVGCEREASKVFYHVGVWFQLQPHGTMDTKLPLSMKALIIFTSALSPGVALRARTLKFLV